jgi:para-nitrobenzyl esterase
MVSPLARGLFHAAIAQSPGGLELSSLKQTTSERASGETLGAGVITKCGLAADADTAAMRKLEAAALIKNAVGYAPARGPNDKFGAFAPYLGPIVDGYTITDSPKATFTAGKECPVPLMIGHTRDEETLFITGTPLPKTPADFKHKIDDTFGSMSTEMAALYPVQEDKDIRDASVRLLTDMKWVAPVRQAARLHTHKGYPTYRYVFSRGTRLPALAMLGAHHGCELAYVFGLQAAPNDADKKVIDLVQGYWVNFAAKGDPNGEKLPKWPKYSAEADVALEIEDGATVREHYRAKFLDAMDRYRNGSKVGTISGAAGK